MITASTGRAQYTAAEDASGHDPTPAAARRFDRRWTAPSAGNPRTWQSLWRDAVTDPGELLRMLGLEDRAADPVAMAPAGFAMRVPRGFVARMRPGDPADPLLLQVLPREAEQAQVAGFGPDPVGDLASRRTAGVLQKYAGRALLVATGSCAVNCRYCFRRDFPYGDESAAANGWQEAIAALRRDAGISEVILSGGDPLSLATAKLAGLTTALAGIGHLRRFRIHTRLPIVLPERVDAGLADWLGALPWPTAVVLHANHPNELDASVAAACARLRATGATLLNQSVLLRDINDSCDTLSELSERLYDLGVVPYYLHQLDRAAGTAHFEVCDGRARELHDGLRARLPGYLVPRLVRDAPGSSAKVSL